MTRMIVRVSLLALVVFACAHGSAFAQAKKGDTEMQVFANFSMQARDAGSAQGLISGQFGKFVSDFTEFGGGPTVSISKSDADLGLKVFARRYFGATKTQPYVGGEFFQLSVKNPDFSYANVLFGAKNYFSDKAAIDFQGAYGFLLQDSTQPLLSFNVGISVLF